MLESASVVIVDGRGFDERHRFSGREEAKKEERGWASIEMSRRDIKNDTTSAGD